jgi:glycosyltransferase involved in cell wall biosynthesis
MLVYNNCTTDARVRREASSLRRAGYDVRVVAVLDATTEPVELRDGVRILRIDRNPIHYRVLRRARQARRLIRRATARSTPPPAPRRAPGRRPLVMRVHKPLMFADFYWRAYRLVTRDGRADAVHAHDLLTLPVASALARRLRVPLIYDAHELYPDVSTLSRTESRVWRVVERLLAHRATRVITVCDSIATELSRRYRVPPPVVLLNCPDATAPAPPDRNLLREAAGLSDDARPLVLYQGGFAPHRGLETLVLAARELDGCVVVLMGWGRIEDELRELIRRERVDDRVRIIGPVPQAELIAYTAGADVGVIPYEPVGLNNTYSTPNKLFEYLAVGLPIVGSRLPEVARIVEGHGLGATFTPGDPADLARVIRELLADAERRAEIRERALRVRDRYTWAEQSRKLVALYAELDSAAA